ncbi:MAG: hypothetical protein R3F53_28885 [Gammaproteobacteria bacterium]
MFIYSWNGAIRSLSTVLVCWLLTAPLVVADSVRQALVAPYSYEQFKAYIGESFRVWGGEGLGRVIELKLESIDVDQIDAKVEQFKLYFSGPTDYKLDTNSYKFQHPQSGVFRLWLEPIADSTSQRWYRVDFNLLR